MKDTPHVPLSQTGNFFFLAFLQPGFSNTRPLLTLEQDASHSRNTRTCAPRRDSRDEWCRGCLIVTFSPSQKKRKRHKECFKEGRSHRNLRWEPWYQSDRETLFGTLVQGIFLFYFLFWRSSFLLSAKKEIALALQPKLFLHSFSENLFETEVCKFSFTEIL